MYTHASTAGTTAQQRTCKELRLLQTKEALHFFFVGRIGNQTTFCTFNTRTSLYPRPAAPMPLQRCIRVAVREHAGIQTREWWSKWLFTRNEGSMKNNQPQQAWAAYHANHDSAAPSQHPLICTGAEPIHQVHDQPCRRLQSRCSNHISTIFPPVFQFVPEVLTYFFEAWMGTTLLTTWRSQANAHQRHKHLNLYGTSAFIISLWLYFPQKNFWLLGLPIVVFAVFPVFACRSFSTVLRVQFWTRTLSSWDGYTGTWIGSGGPIQL